MLRNERPSGLAKDCFCSYWNGCDRRNVIRHHGLGRPPLSPPPGYVNKRAVCMHTCFVLFIYLLLYLANPSPRLIFLFCARQGRGRPKWLNSTWTHRGGNTRMTFYHIKLINKISHNWGINQLNTISTFLAYLGNSYIEELYLVSRVHQPKSNL